MAQPLAPISLIGPGFLGLNTEDSPISDDYRYGLEADNCVIDKYGRLSARKGFKTITTSDISDLGGLAIESMGRYVSDLGNHDILSAGNGNIFKGTETLTTLTTAGWKSTNSYTIDTNANDWTFIPFRGQTFIYQEGYEPLVYDETNGLVKLSSDSNYQTPVTGPTLNDLKTDTATGAYGRMWVAKGTTVYWSNLLVGADFETGDSGSIDVLEYFPNGYDTIVNITAHNGFLIIFGRESIVVYRGADGDPATNLALEDTIAGVSCIAHDSVHAIGTDVLYLSTKGLKSFGRTLTEKSMPLEDLSLSIKTDLLNLIRLESQSLNPSIKAVYSPEDYFYLLTFGSLGQTFCFDIRQRTDRGAFRVTSWPSNLPKCYCLDYDFNLMIGSVHGIMQYDGYNDDVTDSYELNYKSPWMSFGESQRQKFLKVIKPSVNVEGSPDFRTKWSYDFSNQYKSVSKDLSQFTVAAAEFGVAEFGTALFTSGSSLISFRVNANGSGNLASIQCNVTIDGGNVSLQDLQVLALMGKVY